MRKRLVPALWLMASLFLIACAPAYAQFEKNLVVNGNAEAGAGSSDGTVIEPVPGWVTYGSFTVNQYGPSFAGPLATDPGPLFRGANFFAGGPNNAFSYATQSINLSNTGIISRGGVTFSLSGYLGGFSGQSDNAVLKATFRNSSGSTVGTATIGPVTADQRNGATGLFFRSQSGVVPPGTTSIFLELDLTRTDGSYNDGYADNLSLVLHAPKLDVRANGQPELALYNYRTQQVAFWFLNGTNVTDGALASLTLPSGWQVAGSGDFNGDGISDLVLQNPFTGQVAFWFMSGTTVTDGAYASLTLPSNWIVSGVGDINGDGRPDLVLYNPTTQQVAFWYMNGTTVTDGAYAATLDGAISTLPAYWSVAAVADVDGDGYADIVLQNSNTLQVAVWFLNNNTVTAGALATDVLPNGWQITGAGDFNSDGVADLILQNPTTGQVAFWFLGGVTITGDNQLPDSVIVSGGALANTTLPANWLIEGPR